MTQSSIRYLIIAYLTSFIVGFCIMVVEIIGARLIARYLGVSLYTWTSVIGVVLAGISFGNYIGGRIADKFPSRQALATLFILASLSCVLVPVMNNLLGNYVLSLQFPWLLSVTIHVLLIFFLPSCLLGMITPVTAKFALDQKFKIGLTMGNLYAWGAVGSILGTFVTGFFLISTIGSIAVIWTIAGILALVGILYSSHNLFARIWSSIFIILWSISYVPLASVSKIASSLFLTESNINNLVYQKDSQYAYVSVTKDKLHSNVLNLMLDNLLQTKINVNDPLNLKYSYRCHNLFVSIVKTLGALKENPAILNFGGGGYIVPRYIKKHFPKSHIEVVEIDPEVTKAAIKAFGLHDEGEIIIHHMDARKYVEEAVRQKNNGENARLFDFILSDVFSGSVAVPYHLTTYEYNEKIAKLLAPAGLYVINLIDSKDSARFLLALFKTLSKSFDYIYIFSTERESESSISGYGTYVIISSQKEINSARLGLIKDDGQLLDDKTIQVFKDKLKANIILTDDYAPVDNLLKETFRAKGEFIRCTKMMDKSIEFIEANKLDRALKQFENILRINPNITTVYNNIASIKARQGQYEQAIEYYRKALSLEPEFIQAMIGLGNAMDRIGRRKEAIEFFYQIIQADPKLAGVYTSLANSLFAEGRVSEAIENYGKALEIEPALETARRNLNAIVKAENIGWDN